MDIAQQVYYKKPEIVRFLLAENLALKSLLLDKKIITAEEFAEYQQKSQVVLDEKVTDQIQAWKKQNPQEADLLNMVEKVIPSNSSAS